MQSVTRKLGLLVSMLLVLCFASMIIANAAGTTKSTAKTSKPHAIITSHQAEKVALKKYPGKVVEKTKLENEEGVWQYGVMVQSGKTLREVMVNAKTGRIDNVEVTTAEKEKVEAAKEKTKAEGKEKRGEADEKDEAGEK